MKNIESVKVMVFSLNEKALQAAEKTVGVGRDVMTQSSLCFLGCGKTTKNNKIRQIKPRGSVYLQMMRMVSIDRFKEIINKF